MADDKDELFRAAAAAGETPNPPGEAAAMDDATEAAAQSSETEMPHLTEPAQAAVTAAANSPEPNPPASKPPSRAPVLAAALVLGALAGFGGALALRYLEAAQGSESSDRLDQLNARAAELEHKSDASTSAIAALETRLAAAESNAGKAATATGAAIDDLRSAMAARPAAAPQPAPESRAVATPNLAPIESRIDAFEKRLGALQTTLAAPKVDVRAEQERAAAEQNALALSAAHSKGLVAASLVQHISRGEPFSDDVAALETLGADPAKLAPLRASAKTGVASIGDLAEQFSTVAPALDAPEPPKHDDGILDRLVRDASNLVRIHRSGDPKDTDVPGRVAAIEHALARMDVAKAYAIWSQLPEEAKARSAKWGEAAKTRLDALAAASAIEADAVTALSKTKS